MLLSLTVLVLGFLFNLNATDIHASEIILEPDVGETSEVEPQAPVRRFWIESYGVAFPSHYAPALYYYDYGGFAGYLTLIHEDVQMGGTYGIYQGYVYNKNYPIPSPARENEDSIVLEEVTLSTASSKTVYVYRTGYIYNLPTVINYDDGTYRGTLKVVEYWGNKDGTFTATYSGTVYKGAIPLPNSLPEVIE